MALPFNGANSTCKPAVTFGARPVLGGKVVIQGKRYRDTVGTSAVGDLYGTMLNGAPARASSSALAGTGWTPTTSRRTSPLSW